MSATNMKSVEGIRYYMTQLESSDGIEIHATTREGTVLVYAQTKDNRRLCVEWEPDGTGYPVIDELTDKESDSVFETVRKEEK